MKDFLPSVVTCKMEKKEKPVQLIIFDIDGTLAETDDYFKEKAAVLLCKIVPFIKKESMMKFVQPFVRAGETIIHGFYMLLDLLHLDGLVSKIHSRMSVKQEYKYKIVSGARKTIKYLSKRYKLGVISSGGKKSTQAFIYKYNLSSYIKYVISAEDCTFIKPHPMPLQKMAAEAGVPIDQCMLVGDTVFDIVCARRAGATGVAVKTGFDSEWFLKLYKADIILDSVRDLPAFLESGKL